MAGKEDVKREGKNEERGEKEKEGRVRRKKGTGWKRGDDVDVCLLFQHKFSPWSSLVWRETNHKTLKTNIVERKRERGRGGVEVGRNQRKKNKKTK